MFKKMVSTPVGGAKLYAQVNTFFVVVLESGFDGEHFPKCTYQNSQNYQKRFHSITHYPLQARTILSFSIQKQCLLSPFSFHCQIIKKNLHSRNQNWTFHFYLFNLFLWLPLICQRIRFKSSWHCMQTHYIPSPLILSLHCIFSSFWC